MTTDPLRFVAYYRVSTASQGSSGLGLQAQHDSVETFVASKGGQVIAEFREIESGTARSRPELKRALAECARRGATLVIARLDRLARNLYVIASLMESRVEFVAADMPSATKLTVQLIAAIAEHERDQISKNTRLALRVAKENGVKLGNPRLGAARVKAGSVIQSNADQFALHTSAYITSRALDGLALNKIADVLNSTNVPTQRGRTWTPQGVKNVLRRAASLKAKVGLDVSVEEVGAYPAGK